MAVDRVVDCGADTLQETRAGVWGKIDGKFGPICNGASDLDVERDLAVGSARIARRRVDSAADADHLNLRHLEAETLEIRGEVAVPGATAQFQDRDVRAFACDIAREAIGLGDFDRRIRGQARCVTAHRSRQAQARINHRARIQTGYACDNVFQLRWVTSTRRDRWCKVRHPCRVRDKSARRRHR